MQHRRGVDVLEAAQDLRAGELRGAVSCSSEHAACSARCLLLPASATPGTHPPIQCCHPALAPFHLVHKVLEVVVAQRLAGADDLWGGGTGDTGRGLTLGGRNTHADNLRR